MIDSFQGEYRFLSNFWPVKVVFEGHVYTSVEHAYVAAKTTDENARAEIRNLRLAGQVKQYGKTLKLRDDWDTVKLSVMQSLLEQKFEVLELQEKLLDTGTEELIEGNYWGDVYWGVCRGVGENHLGRLLMHIRATHASLATKDSE